MITVGVLGLCRCGDPAAAPARRCGGRPHSPASAETRPPRNPWAAPFRLLERDERLFAFLLAVVMVGGLATLGLAPLRPRYRFDLFSLVLWFAAYKACILALVTVNPRATRSSSAAPSAVDLLIVFRCCS